MRIRIMTLPANTPKVMSVNEQTVAITPVQSASCAVRRPLCWECSQKKTKNNFIAMMRLPKLEVNLVAAVPLSEF